MNIPNKRINTDNPWMRETEDLHSFLEHEVHRAEEMLREYRYKTFDDEARKLTNFLLSCNYSSKWEKELKTLFRGYDKSSEQPSNSPENWPVLSSGYHKESLKEFSLLKDRPFDITGVSAPIRLDFLTPTYLNSISSSLKHTGNEGGFLFSRKDIFDMATHPEILGKVKKIIGDDVVLLDDNILTIPPNGHYDITHSDVIGGASIEGEEFFRNDPGFINVWISINGTYGGRAPLNFFPGTQKLGIAPSSLHLSLFKENQARWDYYARLLANLEKHEFIERNHRLYLELMQKFYHKEYLQSFKRTEINTEPGECIVFNSHTLHGSSPNLTNENRISIVFRYRDANAKPLEFGFPDDVLNNYLEGIGQHRQKDYNSGTMTPIVQVLGNQSHQAYFSIDKNEARELLGVGKSH